MLALATCFCNDIYREAKKRSIQVTSIDVVVTGEFGAEGEPGSNFKYEANVVADASTEVQYIASKVTFQVNEAFH